MIIKNQPPQPDSSQDNQNLPTDKQDKIAVSYNWDALKTEFMQGPWKSVAEFKRDQHMPLNDSSIDRKMKNWANRKKYSVDDVIAESSGQVLEIRPAEIELTRKQQAATARLLQQKGLDALAVFTPRSAEEARKLVVSGLQEERAALGISERGGQPSSLTQVNVSLPKTKFDKIINEQDFAGVLKFIAEIKRERTRRVGGVTSGSGKAATR